MSATAPLSELHFISDDPADTDSFDTHSALASAIATAIRTNPHLKIVGLLGRWGSGKSTVIKFLRDALLPSSDDDDILFFTYDAWLNQSDPQRRAFLERLIAFLIKQDVVESDKWGMELRKLSRPSEETTSHETSVFSGEAKVFALSLSLLALSLPLWGLDTLKEASGPDQTAEGWWAARLVATSVVIPILVWFVIVIKRVFCGEPFRFLPPLLSDEYPKQTFVRTERSPEPTSIEFGRTFRRLLRAASKKGKRLLIIIDNIDRVDENDAVAIWGNIRSLFLASHEGGSAEAPHPTVILPFDDKAVADIFSDSSVSSYDKRREITESFLDKTFDATFYVTEPVSSDWRDFFTSQLKEVFGDRISSDNIFWVKRFFAEKMDRGQVPITPRAITKAINKIAALYLQ